MPRITPIPPRRAGRELRRAYERVSGLWGVRGGPPFAFKVVQGLSHRPRFVEAVGEGYHYAGWAGTLPRATRELVAVLVSRENECFYCVHTHSAFLEAAGMGGSRVRRLAEGDLPAAELGAEERALEAFVRKSARAPARLRPEDLEPLLAAFGTIGTLEIVMVLAAFHFINRVADLAGVASDVPLVQRRWRWLRRLGVRVQAATVRRWFDLGPADARVDAPALLAEIAAVRGAPLAPGYAAMRYAPSVAASLHAVVRELPTIDRTLRERVARAVAAALPADEDESTGFHARPSDPLDALVFVGTRYAARTTDAMVDAVRARYGWTDAEVTDVIFAIGYQNAAERLDRLLAAQLPPAVSDEPRLHVEVEGDGPVVVLGHGFGGSARNFGPQARALRARWRIVRFDARGHARSEAPADPAAYRPACFVADVGRVLGGVGTSRAVVGGLSMGAAVALRFARAHPERVEKLILAAFPAGAREGRGMSGVAVPFADAIERDGLEAAGAAFVWGPASGLDPASARLVRQGFVEHAPHALAYTLREFLAVEPSVAEMAPALAGVAAPTLVVVGAQDAGSRASCEALAAALPDARLVVVPGAGHVVNLQAPAAFNAAVEEFLGG